MMESSRGAKQLPVILLINKLQGGGAERVVAALANAWVEQGKDVHVVLTLPRQTQQPAEYEVSQNVKRHYIGRDRWLRRLFERLPLLEGMALDTWNALFRTLLELGDGGRQIAYKITQWRRRQLVTDLRGLLTKLDAPIVFAFGAALFPIALLVCEGSQTRLVAMERSDPGMDELHTEIRLFRPLAYQKAHLITANSQTALRTIAKSAAPEKLVYIPNPLFDNELLRAEIADEARKSLILIVARLDAMKNHAVLLRAFAMLPPELHEWRLAIVGDGILRQELVALAEQLEISPRVDWHGYVPNPYPFYHQASIFVLPSRYEGQSNALLEAMSVGLSVVVSDTPTLREMVEDRRNGLVVPCNDVAALAHALTELAKSRDLRAHLGRAAREHVATHDLAVVLPQWERLLERALQA